MAGTEGLRKRREGDDLMKLTVAQVGSEGILVHRAAVEVMRSVWIREVF